MAELEGLKGAFFHILDSTEKWQVESSSEFLSLEGESRRLAFFRKTHTHTQRKKESEGLTENEGCLRGFHHKSIEREMTPERVLL